MIGGWNPQTIATGFVALFAFIGAAVFAWIVQVIQRLRIVLPQCRDDKRWAKFYMASLPLGFGVLTSFFMWIFVAGATGSSRASVLAVVAGGVTAIAAASAVWTVALWIDAQHFATSERFYSRFMTAMVWLERCLMFVIAAGLAYGTSVARNDVLPGRPFWHIIPRWMLVIGPMLVARSVESIIRPEGADLGEEDRPSHGFYERLRRGWAFVPPAVAILIVGAFSWYFIEVAQVAPSNGALLAKDFGHLQARGMLLLVGLVFAMFELSMSIETVSKTFPKGRRHRHLQDQSRESGLRRRRGSRRSSRLNRRYQPRS
jgi:hypothetical protein